MKTKKELDSLKEKIAQCAQNVYDNWSQDASGYDEVVGYGGICHLIADEIISLLDQYDIYCTTVSSSHEVHVYVVAKLEEGVFKIDIPYNFYETGGGYHWEKKLNVCFNEDVVYIDLISLDPNDFEKEYCDDF